MISTLGINQIIHLLFCRIKPYSNIFLKSFGDHAVNAIWRFSGRSQPGAHPKIILKAMAPLGCVELKFLSNLANKNKNQKN
jgi:hypothetical protein